MQPPTRALERVLLTCVCLLLSCSSDPEAELAAPDDDLQVDADQDVSADIDAAADPDALDAPERFADQWEPVNEGGRDELLLNGSWSIAEGSLTDDAPENYDGAIAVPGLVTQAEPAFEAVGYNRSDLREAFWYHTTFDGFGARPLVRLVIGRASFGARVWLNGRLVGEHLDPFTRATFDITESYRPHGSNRLVVRVGATRESLPDSVPAGMDIEKERWIPGIWDDVRVIGSGDPSIDWVQVLPDLEGSRITVNVALWALGGEAASGTVISQIERCDGGEVIGTGEETSAVWDGERAIASSEIRIPDFTPWTPDDPQLYCLRTSATNGDDEADEVITRFGMRTVEWRGGDESGFFLNGERVYLRGSNITLHRFFEDDAAGALPWDRDWVRRLLTENPRELHWNTMRMTIGRAPEFWYDIADEEGLLLADEYAMWTLVDPTAASWSHENMVASYTRWIEESRNHPSIAWWDASNETSVQSSFDVIDAVRELDPTRQWENGGYGEPHSPGDPIEDHPYFFIPLGGNTFEMTELEEHDGQPPLGDIPGFPAGTWDDPEHPYINNEYAWLWIDREGQPTESGREPWRRMLGEGEFDAAVYREGYAYLTAGLTEFWRARRGYAGVLHFPYLGYSREGGVTSDNFIDIESLTLEPRWVEYARNAFAPVGVYLDSWREDWSGEATISAPVVVINDLASAADVAVTLMTVSDAGDVLTSSAGVDTSVAAYGSETLALTVDHPGVERFLLVARITDDDGGFDTVWSRRKVGFEHEGAAVPDPPYE